MSRRLRLDHLMILPVTKWDDGDELEDGPQFEPIKLSLSKVPAFLDALPREIQTLAARVLAESKCAICLDRGEERDEGHEEPCVEAPSGSGEDPRPAEGRGHRLCRVCKQIIPPHAGHCPHCGEPATSYTEETP